MDNPHLQGMNTFFAAGSRNVFYPHMCQVNIKQLHGSVATDRACFVGAAMKRNFYIKILQPIQKIDQVLVFSAGKISGFGAQYFFLAVFRKCSKIL
jgi:hypothetical protein